VAASEGVRGAVARQSRRARNKRVCVHDVQHWFCTMTLGLKLDIFLNFVDGPDQFSALDARVSTAASGTSCGVDLV
jgi:hypothetical protein